MGLHQIYLVVSRHKYLDSEQVSSLSGECNRKRHFTRLRSERILRKKKGFYIGAGDEKIRGGGDDLARIYLV